MRNLGLINAWLAILLIIITIVIIIIIIILYSNFTIRCKLIIIIFSIQSSGLGGLKPNTVILGWPYSWKNSEHDHKWMIFLETVRHVTAAKMCLIVPKGINFFPDSTEKVCLNNFLQRSKNFVF